MGQRLHGACLMPALSNCWGNVCSSVVWPLLPLTTGQYLTGKVDNHQIIRSDILVIRTLETCHWKANLHDCDTIVNIII